MKQLSRRSFLKSSSIAAVSLSAWPVFGAQNSRPIGANGDIRYAVIGFRGRGADHIDGMRKVKGTRLVALCDVDSEVLQKEIQKCENRGEKVAGYTDIRKLLANPDIDVVTIATPNHWHSLGAIWAIQGGKDVYVEKPVSHNVWEGRQLVTAARKHQRIVQAGTQSRSSSGIAEGMAWVHEGHLGKVLRARGLCYKRRPSIGKVDGPQPVPANIDYDLWCGPAPKEPLMRKRLHYDWHWVWPTGNGDVGNQGIHEMDLARWMLGESALSPRVLSVGGRLGYEDDGTTPNTQIVFHDYPTAPLIFEVRGLPADSTTQEMGSYRGVSIGVVIECEGGSLNIKNNAAEAIDKDGKPLKSFKGLSSHFENFVEAVRSRNSETLRADILQGHLSSALCHSGNISYRLGQRRSPEEIREAIKANHDFSEALGRMEEHLAANQVEIQKSLITLGEPLKMDPQQERFIGNPKADQLLKRDYRAPFIVPEKV